MRLSFMISCKVLQMRNPCIYQMEGQHYLKSTGSRNIVISLMLRSGQQVFIQERVNLKISRNPLSKVHWGQAIGKQPEVLRNRCRGSWRQRCAVRCLQILSLTLQACRYHPYKTLCHYYYYYCFLCQSGDHLGRALDFSRFYPQLFKDVQNSGKLSVVDSVALTRKKKYIYSSETVNIPGRITRRMDLVSFKEQKRK